MQLKKNTKPCKKKINYKNYDWILHKNKNKLNIQGWNCKEPIHQQNDLKISTKINMIKFDTKINVWGEIVKKKTIQNKTNSNSKKKHQVWKQI